MGIIHYNIPSGADLSILKPEYYTNPGVLSPVTWAYSLGRDRFDEKFINENKNYYQNPIETTYEFGDILVYWHCYGDGQVACNVKARGSSTNLIAFTHDNSTGRPVIEYYLDFAIDTENQKGYFVVISLQHVANRNQWQEFIWLADGGNTLYNLLLNQPFTSNGGGATHIAKVTGQLKDLSSNLSNILMVSGGGGGGLLVGEDAYNGADAGGIAGSGVNSGNQSTGYAFGQGESGTNKSGGGSGLYGGYKGTSSKSGGAGSGYIGNTLVSNKKMVGYNVPTSSAEGTKTESVNEVSASAVSGKPKSGNGFARIMLKHQLKYYTLEDLVKQSDLTHYKKATYSGSGDFGATFLQLSEWFGTDWNLSCVAWSGADYPTKSNNVYTYGNNQQLAYGLYAFAISKKVKVWAYGFDGKFNNVTQDPDHQMHLRLYVLENATYNLTNSIFIGQGSGEGAVNDTDWHTYEKKLSEPSYCNYITFYNGTYVDQLKNIWVLVEE